MVFICRQLKIILQVVVLGDSQGMAAAGNMWQGREGKGRALLTRVPYSSFSSHPGPPSMQLSFNLEIFNNSFRGTAAGKFTGCRSDQTKFTWQYPRLEGRRHSQGGRGSRQASTSRKKGKKMQKTKCVQREDEVRRLMTGKGKLKEDAVPINHIH